MDDWIRLFNAKSEEDLRMIKARNAGIREAVRAIREMSLRKNLRYLYEEHLKRIRDRRGEDEYVRNEGKEEGRIEGRTLQLISQVRKKVQKNNSAEEIAEMLEEEPASIECRYYCQYPWRFAKSHECSGKTMYFLSDYPESRLNSGLSGFCHESYCARF